MGSFIRDLIGWLIETLILCLIVNAILSWLIVFDVVNRRSRFVYQLSRFLDAVTDPVLRPLRRFVPLLGGVDITPVLLIVVLVLFRADVLPLIFAPLVQILG